jgi:hypothetical protein
MQSSTSGSANRVDQDKENFNYNSEGAVSNMSGVGLGGSSKIYIDMPQGTS